MKLVAEAAGVPVLQPAKARDPELAEKLRALRPDVGVVVAYGKILPQSLLDIPTHGCLNVHASLLPRYRGAAPIQWAIIRGERETGVTIMKLDAGMDTGPMLLWSKTAIRDDETGGALATRLSGMGAELMRVALTRLKAGALSETPQDHTAATMAPLLKKEQGNLDWTHPARAVSCLVRGVDPWPGAQTYLGGDVLKIWGARPVEGSGAPGVVLGADREALVVACGEGAVALAELQLPGRKRLQASAFLAGRNVELGARLGVWPELG